MEIENINWNYPTTMWFGLNSKKDIQKACDDLNIKNPLIVTDPGILQTDIINKINNSLNQSADIFSNVQSNPTGQNVEEGVKQFNQNGHDGVIAVGGGSGMDTGKGIAFMSKQERPLWDFEDIGDWWTRAKSEVIFPIIAVTTAGTGSETGRASVFQINCKRIYFSSQNVAWCYLRSRPYNSSSPSLTAFTGMDALAHA